MDPMELARQAIDVLSPYLETAGHSAAGRAGSELLDRIHTATSNLYAHVRARFSANTRAAEDFSKLEQNPGSRGRKTVVQELLSSFIEEDGQFARELEDLVQAVRLVGGDVISQRVEVSGGTVGDITQIGRIGRRDTD